VEVQIIQRGKIALHVARNVTTEWLRHCVRQKHGLLRYIIVKSCIQVIDDDNNNNAQIANSVLILCGPYHVYAFMLAGS